MNESLEFVEQFLPQEVLDTCNRSLELFDSCSATAVYDVLLNIEALTGVASNTEVADATLAAIVDYSKSVLLMHGIKVSEDAEHESLNCLLDAVLALPYYIDKGVILKTLQIPVSGEEVFAELCELTTELSSSRALMVLESVEPALLSSLKEICLANDTDDSDEEVDEALFKTIVSEVSAFNLYTDGGNFVARRLVLNDVVIGMEFSQYVKYVAPLLDKWDDERAGVELLYLLLLSKDGVKDPVKVFQYSSEAMFSSLEKQAAVGIVINKRIASFSSFKLKLKNNSIGIKTTRDEE